jgi:integrase
MTNRRHFGNVRRLGSGRYQASYWHEGLRHTAPNTFTAKADALAYLSVMETNLLRGEWIDPKAGRETFGAYGKRWLAHRPDLRPSTRELYEALWRKWLEPAFNDVPLAAMTPERWRTWYVEQITQHPGSTRPGKAYRLARSMLNTAVEDGRIKVNPCHVKGAGSEQSPERPIAMPDEVAKLAKAIDPKYQAMVLLGAYCSLRFGELAGLRRKRIDLLHRTITVEEQAVDLADGRIVFGPPKTSAGRRTVAFPAELVPIIADHLASYVAPEPDALVFTSPEGCPLRRGKFRHRWGAACRKVGVEGLRFHDLRGSGATWAAHAGATVRELMDRLGHSTPEIALRYQHATRERDRAIADKLGALLRAVEAQPEPASNVVPIERGADDSSRA